jgi:hypothetical protein
LLREKNCSQNLLTMSKNLLTKNQICSRRINFAHGESWIALHSTCNLSMDAWRNFYLHTNCSKRRKFADSKEKLLTKIKFAQSKHLLKKFAHSRNLITEFARSIEKLLTMKNLAGLDGSTQWLNVSHQANRSTAGAHHSSTVSVVTAGTCWAGPSRTIIQHVVPSTCMICIALDCKLKVQVLGTTTHLYHSSCATRPWASHFHIPWSYLCQYTFFCNWLCNHIVTKRKSFITNFKIFLLCTLSAIWMHSFLNWSFWSCSTYPSDVFVTCKKSFTMLRLSKWTQFARLVTELSSYYV